MLDAGRVCLRVWSSHGRCLGPEANGPVLGIYLTHTFAGDINHRHGGPEHGLVSVSAVGAGGRRGAAGKNGGVSEMMRIMCVCVYVGGWVCV